MTVRIGVLRIAGRRVDFHHRQIEHSVVGLVHARDDQRVHEATDADETPPTAAAQRAWRGQAGSRASVTEVSQPGIEPRSCPSLR